MSEREILFRGKHYRTGEWIYGIPVKEPLSGSEDAYFPKIIPDRNGIHRSIERASVVEDTVGQFTGLTDKNDKKIFEHDIVRIAVGGIYANHVVSYDKENARFVVGDIDFTMVRIFSPKIEVIGNIHDNPELLEGD